LLQESKEDGDDDDRLKSLSKDDKENWDRKDINRHSEYWSRESLSVVIEKCVDVQIRNCVDQPQIVGNTKKEERDRDQNKE
jgi:hypothetical protein